MPDGHSADFILAGSTPGTIDLQLGPDNWPYVNPTRWASIYGACVKWPTVQQEKIDEFWAELKTNDPDTYATYRRRFGDFVLKLECPVRSTAIQQTELHGDAAVSFVRFDKRGQALLAIQPKIVYKDKPTSYSPIKEVFEGKFYWVSGDFEVWVLRKRAIAEILAYFDQNVLPQIHQQVSSLKVRLPHSNHSRGRKIPGQ